MTCFLSSSDNITQIWCQIFWLVGNQDFIVIVLLFKSEIRMVDLNV